MTQNVNFKIPKWQAAAILKIEKLQYLVNISSVSTVRHLGFLKLLSDRHVLRHLAKFCGDRLYLSMDIAIFRVF